MKSLHKLALPGHRQVTGDFAQPGERQMLLNSQFINAKLYCYREVSPAPGGKDELRKSICQS